MRPRLLCALWILLAFVACEVIPPRLPVANRLEEELWSLVFVPDGGDSGEASRLQLEHRDHGVIAQLHHARLILGPNKEETLLPFESAERRGDALLVSCVPHPDQGKRGAQQGRAERRPPELCSGNQWTPPTS